MVFAWIHLEYSLLLEFLTYLNERGLTIERSIVETRRLAALYALLNSSFSIF